MKWKNVMVSIAIAIAMVITITFGMVAFDVSENAISYTVLILGAISVFIATMIRNNTISGGVSGGGILLILSGLVGLWSVFNNFFRFFVAIVALVFLIWIAYKKFK